MPFATLTAAWLLGAPVQASLEAGVRQEMRARSRTAADVGARVAGDAELRPHLIAGLAFSYPHFVLGYSPILNLREPYGRGARAEVLHNAELRMDLPLNQRFRLSAAQNLSYGENDFSSLTALINPAGTALEPVPRGLKARTLSSASSAGLQAQLSRLVTFGMTLGFTYSGGADRPSRAGLPIQRVFRLGTELGVRVSPLDSLATLLAASRTSFDTGAATHVLELGERWQRRLARHTDLTLTASVNAVQERRFSLMPGAAVSLVQRFAVPRLAPSEGGDGQTSGHAQAGGAARAAGLEGRLGASVAPYFDRLTTQLYERVQADASLLWAITNRAAATGSALWAMSLATPASSRMVLGLIQTGVSYRMDVAWQIEGGARNAWDWPLGPGQRPLHHWEAYVALSLREQLR